jgi:uncharacterized membrane protein YbhN (UPF0104 family)
MRAKVSFKRGLGAWLTDAVFVLLVLVVTSQVSGDRALHWERNHILVALAMILPYAALRVALARLWRRRRDDAGRVGATAIERRKR